MTQASIYEQRKGKGWLLASWGEYTCLTSFGDEVAVSYLERVFYRLMDQLKIEGLQVHVVQLVSDWEFILFVLDCLSQKTNRSLTAHRHKGCILIEEEGQLVYVHLPEQGVPLVDFLGTASESSQLGEVVLIATRNAGKTREFQRFFEPLGYRVENLTDYPDLPEVAETGVTFEENARLKAETIAKLTGKMVLADDSGLKVDALGGLPGVWSARFSGPDATDARNNAKLLHELATVFELKDRTAQFHCTLVLAAPGMESLVVSAEWGGRIAFSPQGEQGFGYDPLFLVGEGSLTAAELSLEEKNAQSHRARALEQLMEEFPAWQHLTHS